jgi:M6 family metalloprotease-like protein
MCIVCQAITVGAAALTGILPVAAQDSRVAPQTAGVVPPNSAQPASIGGKTCKKEGLVRSTSTGQFKCRKVGKRRIWQLAATTSTRSSTSTTIATPRTSLDSEFAQVNECKLRKPVDLPKDDGPTGSVGFPRDSASIASEGSHKGLLLFIDFSDVPAGSDLRPTFESWQAPLVEQFFEATSYGNYNLKIVPSSKVYRVKSPSSEYNLTEAPGGGPLPGVPVRLQELLFDAMTAADSDINFSEYAFVSLAAPISGIPTLSGAFGVSLADSQRFDGARFQFSSFAPLDAVLPKDQYNKIWNWSHDIGHMLGLMHPYNSGTQIAWDIMFNFAPQPDFLGWNKWKLNWISDSEVACLTEPPANPLTILLKPVGNKAAGKKLLTVRLGPTTAIAIEVRRGTKLDKSPMSVADEGTIVYRVDTTRNGDTRNEKSGPFELVSNPTKTTSGWNQYVVGTLKPNETTVVENFEIKVVQSAVDGDYVSVKRRN